MSRGSEKRSVSVILNGQRFMVRSDDSDEYVAALADYVNARYSDVARATGRIESHQIALLAAMDIADDLFREKKETLRLRREIVDRANVLLGAIDRLSNAVAAGHMAPAAIADPASEPEHAPEPAEALALAQARE